MQRAVSWSIAVLAVVVAASLTTAVGFLAEHHVRNAYRAQLAGASPYDSPIRRSHPEAWALASWTAFGVNEPINPKIAPIVAVYIPYVYSDGTTMFEWAGSGVFVSPTLVMTAAHVLVRVKFTNPGGSEPPEEPSRRPKLYPWLPKGYDVTERLATTMQEDEWSMDEPLKPGDEVRLRVVGLFKPVEVKATVVYRNSPKDVGVVKVDEKEFTSSAFVPVDPHAKLDFGAPSTFLGVVMEQPIVVPLNTSSPSFELLWGGDDINEENQLMVLSSPGLYPGTSGGAILNSEGKMVAVHVGGIRYAFSIETPLFKVASDLAKLGIGVSIN